MFHAMLIGWFPYNKSDRFELEREILKDDLNYKQLKRVKNSSIKNEMRRELNRKLKKCTDECIDLLEKMLCKDPVQRIEMLDIFDHPFI